MSMLLLLGDRDIEMLVAKAAALGMGMVRVAGTEVIWEQGQQRIVWDWSSMAWNRRLETNFVSR